jgi:hypothetical protein
VVVIVQSFTIEAVDHQFINFLFLINFNAGVGNLKIRLRGGLCSILCENHVNSFTAEIN